MSRRRRALWRYWPVFAALLLALAIGAGMTVLAEREILAQTDREIAADVQSVRHVGRRAKMAGALDLLEMRGRDSEGRIYYALWDDESGLLIATNLAPSQVKAARAADDAATRALPVAHGEAVVRGRRVALDDDYSAFIGRSTSGIKEPSLVVFAIALALAALLIILLAWQDRRAYRRLQRRLMDAEQALRAFARGQRQSRIASHGQPPHADDALSRLSQQVDIMLDFLASRLASQDVVAEQIAHELRNPLAHAARRIAALDTSDEGSEAQSIGQTAVADLLHVVDAVLFLTEIRARPLNRKPFRLDMCIGELCDLYAPAAEEKGVILAPTLAQTMVDAERPLVERMAANLIDNAIKYSPFGGTVFITTRPEQDGAELCITDQGHGLPALPTQPGQLMARGPMVGDAEGSGLGLALAMRIMDLHGGALELHAGDNGIGLSARARFPAYSSSNENAAQ